jgi:hypothetical protein
MFWEDFVIAYYLSRSGQHYRCHETFREWVTLLILMILIDSERCQRVLKSAARIIEHIYLPIILL